MASAHEAISELAARFAEEVTLKIYGEKGPPENCDIDAIEEDAVRAARAAFDAVIAQALRLQNQQLPDQLPCPKCQELCPVATEKRTVQGRMGPATIQEPVCHCSACGRDFFPSAGALAAG
jgi:hypothetical protein